ELIGSGALVLACRVKVTRAGCRLELDLFASAFGHGASPFSARQISPRWRRSASTTSMPTLSMVRNAALVIRKRTHRRSLSTQKRRYCRFGMNRRLVLLLACET